MRYKKFYLTFIVIVLLSIYYYFYNVIGLSVEAGNLKIHFINVGQADAILVQGSNTNLLIDSGTKASESIVVKYLKKHNIKNIQFAVATHPHEDHIGGFPTIFEKFMVDKFYLSDATATTKIYTEMLQAAIDNNITYSDYKTNGTFEFDNANFEILYTEHTGHFDNLNNNSLMLKITHKNNTFLFCGDVERDAEQAFINKYSHDLKSNVIKIAHHGSKTSSMPEFLHIVSPQYAVITCEVNKALPSDKTIEKLNGLQLYRTDIDGNIVILSDGETITFKTHEPN